MEEKRKRIVTKIGNIFCVEIGNEYKCYFQYIANDLSQLNSSVIRVFKKKYSIAENPEMESIVLGEVSFYAHTILRVGIMANAWYKVGTSKNIGDVTNIGFRDYSDVNWVERGQTVSCKWTVWKINQERRFVGKMTDEYRKYDNGWVLPYIQIVHKIETGSYINFMD